MSIQFLGILVINTLLGLSLAWFVLVCFSGEKDDGPGSRYSRRQQSKPIFLVLFGGLINILGAIFSTLPIDRQRKKLQRLLMQAGSPGGLNADEFNAAKVVIVVLFVLVGMFFDSELDTTPLITFAFLGLGIFYPGMWLNGVMQKRRRRIFRDLPDTLDTLRLAVDAGLDLSSAMKVLVEQGRRGPLLEELEEVEREIQLGRTRQDAFRSFADRLQMSEINAFVLALIQADQLGASVSPVLKVQGEMARTRRWQLAEALVNKMPMKMLGPLVIFIFPASFIILFTPLLIQYIQSTE